MAKKVTFNGITQVKPGGILKVDAKNFLQTNLDSNGIVAVIGEADAGVGGLTIVDDPTEGIKAFRSGPLADAMKIAFAPTNDPNLGSGAFRVLAYKVNTVGAAQGLVHLPADDAYLSDTATTGSTTTVINFGTLTSPASATAYKGYWLKWNNQLRRIVSNSTSGPLIITVSPGFSSAPASSDALVVLQTSLIIKSKDYGAHTNQMFVEFEDGATSGTYLFTGGFGTSSEQSPEILGKAALEFKYVGGPIMTNGSGTLQTVTSTTVTLNVAAAPSLNAFAGLILQFPDGEQRLIASNTAADPTVITLDPDHALSNDLVTRYNSSGETATVRNVTQANVSISGSSGVATTITSAVLPTADNLNYTFDTNQTLRQFVTYINNQTNYRAVIPAGVNPDTTLMKEFDFGTRATSVDCRFDSAISYSTKGTFRKDLQDLVDWINDNSSLFTATRGTGTSDGKELPITTGGVASIIGDGPYWLRDGQRGTSTNTTWQAAFDDLLDERSNHVVPLIVEDLVNDGLGSTATFNSVAAQLGNHIIQRNAEYKNECGGYIGCKGSRTVLIQTAGMFNNGDVQISGQKASTTDAQGNLITLPEWSTALAVAAARAGAPEVGTPLTFKYFNFKGVTQDSSWKPNSRTDLNLLLDAGVLVFEQVNGAGFRLVRDITTYSIDDNLAFTDGNIRDTVRFLSYDLRTDLENTFTGNKATRETVLAVKNRIAKKMEAYLDNNLITVSLDPETETKTLPGYRNLRVRLSGDIIYYSLEIFPAPGVNYQLGEVGLQLPVLNF